MKTKRVRSTQATLIAMKKSVIERCLHKQLAWKDGAAILCMHIKALSRLKRNYLRYGDIALIGRKPGPKSYQPPVNKTEEATADLIEHLALTHPNEGPLALSDRLLDEYGSKLDQTTVWRILKRRKVRYTAGYRRWKENPKLYCLDIPGEELQLDACYPYGRARKICSFDAIDDCTRFGKGRCYERETADNAILFLNELVRTVPYPIKRIRVDNRYGKKFREYCQNTYNIEVIANEPYTPEQNGKVERFHRTLKREFFYRYCSFSDSLETLNYKYSLWLTHYNYHRRHRGYGMGGRTPAQKLAQTLLQETANTFIINPQKVTGTLQQYNT